MELWFERVAGLDIGKATLTVYVRIPGLGGPRVSEVRTYPTMTRSLQTMHDWLVANWATMAAMEPTSTYWKGAFYCLQEVMTAWLLNAAGIKVMPGGKTDVKDAEWIAQLLEFGGQPVASAAAGEPPAAYARPYRVQQMGARTRDTNRLERCSKTPASTSRRWPRA